jgi:hypothetical protein
MIYNQKIQNPEKEYLSNMGKKWTHSEETLLIEELNKNMDIKTISESHKRTIGGINSRRREIAYKMYLENISIEEIIKQTKLDDECIRQIIEKKQNNIPKKITDKQEIKKPISIISETIEMKNEIKDLKNTIKELVEIMKTIYK